MTHLAALTSSLLTLSLALALPAAARAEPTIPVRVRVLRGARQGPAAVDPRLQDLQRQLGKLAYQRWDQVAEEVRQVPFKRPVDFALPGGGVLQLTLEESRRDTVTFLVQVPGGKTRSRLTIGKDQRIVHQVTPEKDGAALFATVRPWP